MNLSCLKTPWETGEFFIYDENGNPTGIFHLVPLISIIDFAKRNKAEKRLIPSFGFSYNVINSNATQEVISTEQEP